ncbi:N-acetylmuramoyl-L-alanine amidase [Kitasatospora sp. NBC_01266]|uniref:N-acetylmuramoyl-L-alanine amidase n=1 Tax=Kitasatospora sp. NBC_01266 TaxID=2903572 RepID=UPI002E3208E1|nr:N-acetylmuramoyl-L-alanine amidase [Kitasatospora sp. NBC_01266]
MSNLSRSCRRLPAALVALALVGVTGPAWSTDAASDTAAGVTTGQLQRQFDLAAREFGVPRGLLLALAYQESRWESHQGQPSTTGNYGVLGLTGVDVAALNAARAGRATAERDARGDGAAVRADRSTPDVRPLTDSPALHTLDAAATLIHRPPAALRGDSAQNIRGGAALLARYQREAGGSAVADPARWYQAVARFGGGGPVQPGGAQAGRVFADRVLRTVRTGAARTTSDGQLVVLPPDPDLLPPEEPGTPDASDLLGVLGAMGQPAECPADLGCGFTPAAYALTDPKDPTSYGNYNPANRPEDGQAIRYIVIHDTEGDYAGSLAAFQDPHEQACAHYLIRASDGHVTQLVRTKDIAWHAGNKTINMHSIGIEHEGYAVPTDRPTWYSEQLYESSAELVRYLAARFGVPLDRQHIIGHDDVPGPTQGAVADMHWDPGTIWDWSHYLDLLGAPVQPGTDTPPKAGDTVTIAPPFDAANEPPVSGLAARPENFVYLRTRPQADAPLVNGGGTKADDWSDKAVTGTRYVVADRQGDWTAIWYDGQKCWFFDPNGRAARTDRRSGPAEPTLLTPRPGLSGIPVYGRAYPEAAAYARYPAIKVIPVEPLKQTIPAGQRYLAVNSAPQPADYFYDENINGDAPDDRTLVVGKETYYPIRFNHRLAFLKAADVQVVPAAVE